MNDNTTQEMQQQGLFLLKQIRYWTWVTIHLHDTIKPVTLLMSQSPENTTLMTFCERDIKYALEYKIIYPRCWLKVARVQIHWWHSCDGSGIKPRSQFTLHDINNPATLPVHGSWWFTVREIGNQTHVAIDLALKYYTSNNELYRWCTISQVPFNS